MGTSENNSQSTWEKIQTGVRDTERLLGQKKYNLAMIRARQTLEFMVKSMCDRAGIMEGGLIDMIDALYEEQIISKTTCEHYHKIRTIGNKAIHEEDNNAYNANQAHHLLSQEVYTFANDYNEKRRKPAAKQPSRTSSSARSSQTRSSSGRPQQRRSSSSQQRRRRQSSSPLGAGSLLRILIPLALVIILIFIIRIFMPGKDDAAQTTAPITTEASLATMEPTTEAPTEPPTEAPTEPSTVTYKTDTTVNVREEPNTDSRKLVVLGPDSTVEFLRDYDDTWAVISYDGGEAYVSKQYIDPVSQ